jgi:hypothetical protein
MKIQFSAFAFEGNQITIIFRTRRSLPCQISQDEVHDLTHGNSGWTLIAVNKH